MEWIKIFDSLAALEAMLPVDQPRLLILRGKRICLVRRGEKLLAVDDACPHNGESLSKGRLNFLGEIVCPWHGQRFNMITGREAAEQSRDLLTYPVRQDNEGVYIGL